MEKLKEQIISFKTAQLLKENGFPQCSKEEQYAGLKYNKDGELTTAPYAEHYRAVTISLAAKWLRDTKGIFIEIFIPSHTEHEDTIYHDTFSFDIFNLKTRGYRYCRLSDDEFKTYEKATEAAIDYILENKMFD
jgi:hypothetical protein